MIQKVREAAKDSKPGGERPWNRWGLGQWTRWARYWATGGCSRWNTENKLEEQRQGNKQERSNTQEKWGALQHRGLVTDISASSPKSGASFPPFILTKEGNPSPYSSPASLVLFGNWTVWPVLLLNCFYPSHFKCICPFPQMANGFSGVYVPTQ